MSARPLLRPGLYAITDSALLPGKSLITGVEAALRGGAVLVQYRDKLATSGERKRQAASLLDLCHDFSVPLIINDDPDLAHQTGADGVHLGHDDPAPQQVRQQFGPEALIGVTCHDDLAYARQMAGQPADYVAFGRFFPSQTKNGAAPASLDVLRAARELTVPRVAIGGITLDNVASVIAAGADLVAVVHGLFGTDQIEARARAFSDHFIDRNGLN